MRVTVTPDALADLVGIGDYIAKDNPERAPSYVDELLAHCLQIGDWPEAYRARPEWGGVRCAPFGNYQIVYEINDATVWILRVAHGRMNVAGMLGKDE